ncbi:MAG: hypothetical protein Kow0060_19200 [Methylohalobius crimeensis]
MSGIPQTRQAILSTLSPIHLGTDQDYTPTDYIIEDDVLYEFGSNALDNLPRPAREELDRILAGPANTAMLKRIQAFFYRQREWLIPDAVNTVKVSPELAALYRDRIGKAAQREGGGREVQNRLEIERAAYHPVTRRLFFPGSGIKGAIRTALLDQINDGQTIPTALKKDRRANQIIQKEIFGGGFHTDPMRLFHTGDCHWCGPDALNSAEVLFAVNRKKKAVLKDGREVRSQAEQNNLDQMLECCPSFRMRAFRGQFAIADVDAIGKSRDLPELRFDFADIAQACNRFYRPIWEREWRLLKSRGFLDAPWADRVEKLMNDPELQARMRRGEAFLLRVGRHSGAESVTLGGDGVRSIRIMKGKGQPPAYSDTTKTLWVGAEDRQDRRHLIPFGWVLVEWQHSDEALPPWETAEDLTRQTTGEMRSWLAQVQSRKISLAQRQNAARQAAETRAKEDAERRREEEEKARRLAEMSEEERALESLREMFERDRKAGRKEAGGELANQINEWLKAASDWPPAQKRALADLAEAVYRYLGMLKGRRGRERKARIRALTESAGQ